MGDLRTMDGLRLDRLGHRSGLLVTSGVHRVPAMDAIMNAKELVDLWEPLAARCPELRPEGLSFHDNLPFRPDPAWFPRSTAPQWDSGPPLHPDEAAALWRDSAVRWLRTRRWVALCRDPGDGACAIYGGPDIFTFNPVDINTLVHGPTLDHAIAAAVKAVLDAIRSTPA